MKSKIFLIFITYIWAKTLFGLMFHPFIAIRQVARRPVLFPVIFSPFLGLIILFIAGRIAVFIVDIYGLKRELMAFLLSTTLISILLWQILLIYLLISFILALWRYNK